MTRWIASVMAIGFFAAIGSAADWPQWMGPSRNNVAADSPALVDSFGGGKPEKLWTSEEIFGGWKAGWGTVAVVDGKAYVLSSFNYKIPFPERKLDGNGLKNLGYVEGLPEDLAKKVDEGRTSDELAAIKDGKERDKWINAWMDANVPDDLKRFRGAVQMRMRGGNDWPSAEQLAKLATIVDKEYPDQKALDAWFAANGIADDKTKRIIMRVIPVDNPAAKDFLFCLDALTGKTAWKTELPATHMSYPDSSTPCVVDGTLYVLSSDGFLCALDAAKGELKWKTECPRRDNWHRTRNSSPVVADGSVFVLTEAGLVAVDAKSGEKKWEDKRIGNEGSSPTPVTLGGKLWLLVNGSNKFSLVDASDGKTAWFVRGGGEGSPLVVGDVAVINAGAKGGGVRAVKLSSEKGEDLWSVPLDDDYTTPVVCDGYVYAVGKHGSGWKMFCVKLADGSVAWQQDMPKSTEYGMPVVADGKLLVVSEKELILVKAAPDKYTELGKADLGIEAWTSATIADGKVYLRQAKAIICVDLKK